MLIDTFSSRLQKALDSANMKQVELCKKTGLDKTLINKYLSGKAKARQPNLSILAKALEVSEIWLMGYDVPNKDCSVSLDPFDNMHVTIPIIKVIKPNYDYLAKENWVGTVNISQKLSKTGTFFAWKVKGNSMIPAILENDLVIIQKQNDCETNELALVSVNGAEATIKKVKKTPNGIFLQSLNTDFEPLIFSYEQMQTLQVEIMGIVKELKREF